MKLDIRAEYEDDNPQDVVHNHFDCPACGTDDAATDAYCNLSEEPHPARFTCAVCGATFRHVGGYIGLDADWEQV